jgi:hypothetical protein
MNSLSSVISKEGRDGENEKKSFDLNEALESTLRLHNTNLKNYVGLRLKGLSLVN